MWGTKRKSVPGRGMVSVNALVWGVQEREGRPLWLEHITWEGGVWLEGMKRSRQTWKDTSS